VAIGGLREATVQMLPGASTMLDWLHKRISANARSEPTVKAGNEPVVLAGHSHTIAISRHPNGGPAPELIKIDRFDRLYALVGPWPRDEQYWDELERLAKTSSIALQWGGSEHSKHLFQSNPPFDFVPRNLTNLPVEETFAIIPDEVIRADFESMIGQLDRLLAGLRSVCRYNVFVLGSPPPKPDESFLRARLEKEPFFIGLLEQIGFTVENVKFTRPMIRLKLWHTLQELFAEAAARHGAHFLPVPASVKDAIGFLAPQHWAGDVTHADFQFGDIMANKLLCALSTATEAEHGDASI